MDERWTYWRINGADGEPVAVRIRLEDQVDANPYAATELTAAGPRSETADPGVVVTESEAIEVLGTLQRGDDDPADTLERHKGFLRNRI